MQKNLINFISIKRLLRLASTVCISLAVYGCSSTNENAAEQGMTPEQQQLFILDKIESWSDAEPDIQRILALEADMQLLIGQLASLSDLDDQATEFNKSPTPINKVESKNITTENTTIIAKNTSNTINAEKILENKPTNNAISQPITDSSTHHTTSKNQSVGHYFPKVGIHIGMFKAINDIPLGWQYLQSILPTQLLNKKPLISKINYENMEYYSLRIGPFKSSNRAKRMCINLKQKAHYCSVVEYKGLVLHTSKNQSDL